MAQNPPSLIPTRKSLISRLKNWDDQRSWNDFFNTYSKLMYGVAIQAGLTDAEAKEVVQETVISVAKKIAEFHYDPAVGSFKGWLLTTTRWRITDQFRKRQRDAARLKVRNRTSTGTATIERVPDPAPCDLDAICEKEWQKTVFEAALRKVKEQVNPKHYQIFDLYVVKRWPAHKVATTLGITSGKVFLVKHRMAALLKAEIKRLEEKGI